MSLGGCGVLTNVYGVHGASGKPYGDETIPVLMETSEREEKPYLGSGYAATPGRGDWTSPGDLASPSCGAAGPDPTR